MPASSRPRHRPEGIAIRHARRCGTRAAGSCDCRPGYQAQVFSPRDGKTIRKTFPTLTDARAWRAEAQSALRRGTLRAPTRTTIGATAEEWLLAARAGPTGGSTLREPASPFRANLKDSRNGLSKLSKPARSQANRTESAGAAINGGKSLALRASA